MPKRKTTPRYLMAGLLAPLVFLPFPVVAGLVTPRYSHVASTFSDSAAQGAPHPEIIGIGLLLMAVCLALFSVGFARVIPRMPRITRLCVLVTAFSIGGTAIFQDYDRASQATRNTEGYLHNAFALIGVFAILASIACSGFAIRGYRPWSALLPLAVGCFVVAAVSGLAFNFGPDSRDGLAERVLAFSALLWVSSLGAIGLWTLDALPSLRPLSRPTHRTPAIEPVHVSSDD